jgi:hypothetical protein
LIVMASPPGGLALSISAAACADSSDSNVSIDVPVFSLSLTHCAETKPDAWRIRGIPSCLKKLLACSKSWERAPNHQCVHCCLPSATGPADPTPLANGCEVPDRPRPRPRGWASRRSRRTPGRSRARGRRDRRALTMMRGRRGSSGAQALRRAGGRRARIRTRRGTRRCRDLLGSPPRHGPAVTHPEHRGSVPVRAWE